MTLRVNTESFLAGVRVALDGVSDAVSEEGLRAVGFAGAKVLRDEAILNASRNRDTGTLMNNIIVKRIEEKSNGAHFQTYYVMVRHGKMNREGDAYYWRWVENGHKIVGHKTNESTTWKAHRAAAEQEYGSQRKGARPFMRPAFDAKRGEAVEAMRIALSRILTEGIGGA